MRRFMDLYFIAASAGWKWILGALIGIAAIVGILFGVGVIGGGSDDSGSRVFAPKPTRSATSASAGTPSPTPRPTRSVAATSVAAASVAATSATTAPPPPTASAVAPQPTPIPATARPAATALPEPPPMLTMQVIAVAADNIGALEFVLVYDPALLELAGVQAGSLASDALVDLSSSTPGRVWAGIVAAEGIDGNGPLTELTFRWLQEADGPVPLTLESVSAYNADTLVDVIPDIVPGQAERTGAVGPVLLFR